MAKVQRAPKAHVSRHLGKFWTASNVLSMLRAVLAVPVTYLILIDGPVAWIFGLILFAVLTDWFDGRLARWSHTVSDWGKVLDPLADKIAAVAVTVALVFRPVEPTLPGWFLAVLVVRDGAIVLGGIVLSRRTGEVLMSIWWGKVAVSALAVTIIAALLKADPPVMQFCIWTTMALMLYAFGLYVIRFRRVWREGQVPSEVSMDGEGGRTIASIHPETS